MKEIESQFLDSDWLLTDNHGINGYIQKKSICWVLRSSTAVEIQFLCYDFDFTFSSMHDKNQKIKYLCFYLHFSCWFTATEIKPVIVNSTKADD